MDEYEAHSTQFVASSAYETVASFVLGLRKCEQRLPPWDGTVLHILSCPPELLIHDDKGHRTLSKVECEQISPKLMLEIVDILEELSALFAVFRLTGKFSSISLAPAHLADKIICSGIPALRWVTSSVCVGSTLSHPDSQE